MKTLKFIILALSLICSVIAKAQTNKGFEINGHLDGLEDGVVVKLANRFKDWHYPTWTDSCVVKNGNFHIKSNDVPEGPRQYELYFFKGKNGHSYNETFIDSGLRYAESHSLSFFLVNGDKIAVKGNKNQWKEINVSGSIANNSLAWESPLFDYALNARSKIEHRLLKIRDSVGYSYPLIEQQMRAKENLFRYLDSITKDAPRGYQVAIPTLLFWLHYNGFYHGYFEKDLFSSLPLSVQNSYDGKLERNLALLSIGQPFPDFNLPTPQGHKIALKDFLPQNKITLVHFWGTNSFDVDKYQRELKLFFKKYHPKGLNIIGVSADSSLQEWKDRVDIENYPWTNVIAEPKGWKEGSLINDAYGEGGHRIPNTTNVLLDGTGKIIAWDISGIELQYYLEKYLGK